MKMKSLILVLGLAFSSIAAQASVEEGAYSLGGFFGGTMGAVATYNWSTDYYLDAAVSMEMGGDQNVHAWGDILFRQGELFLVMDSPVTWYWGGGGKFRSENDVNAEEMYFAGPRGVAGLNSELSESFNVYVEASYSYYVVESTKGEFDAFVGARYYF